ncbi:MAG: DegT/DnrJ/EryC1/StrS family aminotransferase [Pirellulales bacterium]
MEVPFFVPDVSEEEIASVVETLRSGWLTTGPKVRQFEDLFADYVGARHAVAVNSATAALHLGLEAAGVRRDDEVIVPTMTFTATAEVAVYLGARPVLVDCLDDTLNIDPDAVAAAVTDRTKAIVPVHYGGQPCRMDELQAIASEHKLAVIEDAAHALPASYRGQRIGTLSAVTCFSFYANKTITTGEGGMATTEDEALAERMRTMRLHGLSKGAWNRFAAQGAWYYEILEAGYKYNLTDIAAAIGIGQLARCDDFRRQRYRVVQRYDQGLAGLAEVRTPVSREGDESAWHLYVIRLETDRLTIDRNAFIEQLTARGIKTSVHYTPLHMHPYYARTYGYKPDDFPVAAAAYEQIISLPIFPTMSDQQVDYVVDCVRSIAEEHRA